jgi:transposase
MIEQINAIENEQVDDIPLLLAAIKQMGLIDIFNEQFKQHGNWEGSAVGYIIAVWLAYILSEGDHRKSYLQEWVAEREHTLLYCLDIDEINELDFTDDKLSLILNKFSDDETWQKSECAVNKHIIRVYDLDLEIVRIDTTTASSYGQVTEGGLLQFGHSKDHRPDLGQVKIASATLDPLGMPLVTLTVSGEQADDVLYIPAVAETRKSLDGKKGLLYVGDAKMGALAIRSDLAYHQEYYLMPLSKVQVNADMMANYLDTFDDWPEEERVLEEVLVTGAKGNKALIAKGFTVTENHNDSCQENGKERVYEWEERRFIVLSPEYAKKQRAQLEKQIKKAETAIQKLVQRRHGYKYPETVADLKASVATVLAAHGCKAYLAVTITEETTCKQIRAYKQRPARVEKSTVFRLEIEEKTENLKKVYRLMGWRAYATNAPEDKLSLSKAVEVYRDAYLHEHGYSRLKGNPLSLTPMYLQKEDQITGLIRLLSLALRVLTLIEFVVRKQLAEEGDTLQGVYAGNRKRKTKTPRTETMLGVFKGIILTIIHDGEKEWVHLNPLKPTQKRILQLLGMTEDIYTSLVPKFTKVVLKSAN